MKTVSKTIEEKGKGNYYHNIELQPHYIIHLKRKSANNICKQLTLGERRFEEEGEDEKLKKKPLSLSLSF